jgi:nitric oxide reductase subunit B
MVAYIISMTELLILGNIIIQWRRSLGEARKNYHRLPMRLLTYADVWIFLNLALAIAISVPAWNYFTHGTHITVAHAMGATIGINTMLLLASMFYFLQKENIASFLQQKRWISSGIIITNVSLLVFWASLLGSGLVKINSTINKDGFFYLMQKLQPYFKLFTYSGIFIFLGLGILAWSAFKILAAKKQAQSSLSHQEFSLIETESISV